MHLYQLIKCSPNATVCTSVQAARRLHECKHLTFEAVRDGKPMATREQRVFEPKGVVVHDEKVGDVARKTRRTNECQSKKGKKVGTQMAGPRGSETWLCSHQFSGGSGFPF